MKKSIFTLLCLIMMSAQATIAKTVTVVNRKPVSAAVHHDKGPEHKDKKHGHVKKHHGQHKDCKKCFKWNKRHNNKFNKKHTTHKHHIHK